MTQRNKNYWVLTPENMKKRIGKIQAVLAECEENVSKLRISISDGNIKLGNIPSVSLLPVIDCGNCKQCCHSCYDLRNDFIYKQTIQSRCTNSAILRHRPEFYFESIHAFLGWQYPRAFRWHIGGDIKDEHYLDQMCWIAKNHEDIKFLCFTKMFSVVNSYITLNGPLPSNLHILFSGWLGLEIPNPHNLPTAHPIFPDGTSAPDGTRLCTGNCTECMRDNRLCWSLGKGESVGFVAH